jgi:hypothetical protein
VTAKDRSIGEIAHRAGRAGCQDEHGQGQDHQDELNMLSIDIAGELDQLAFHGLSSKHAKLI